MRKNLFAIIATATALVCSGSVSAAEVQDRYCLQGPVWGYPGNCLYSTYEQCQASASGTDAACGANPQYLFAHPHGDDALGSAVGASSSRRTLRHPRHHSDLNGSRH